MALSLLGDDDDDCLASSAKLNFGVLPKTDLFSEAALVVPKLNVDDVLAAVVDAVGVEN